MGTWLCESCARKRVFGQKAKKEAPSARHWFHKGNFDWERSSYQSVGDALEEWLDRPEQTTLAQKYYGKVARQNVQPADDLKDIAVAARPEGFLGVIYADGNNLGALLRRTAHPAAYQEFARAIYKATIEATFTALATHLHPYRHHHPFEILSIGGDDVFLIVPAQAALPMAITIATHAEAQLCQYSRTQIPGDCQWQHVHRIAPPPHWQAPTVQSEVRSVLRGSDC